MKRRVCKQRLRRRLSLGVISIRGREFLARKQISGLVGEKSGDYVALKTKVLITRRE